MQITRQTIDPTLEILDALYRVGSFLVLGATFLLGSYAYNRLRLHGDE